MPKLQKSLFQKNMQLGQCCVDPSIWSNWFACQREIQTWQVFLDLLLILCPVSALVLREGRFPTTPPTPAHRHIYLPLLFSSPVRMYRRAILHYPHIGGGKCFTLKFFYVMSKALSGELSCTWTGLVSLFFTIML